MIRGTTPTVVYQFPFSVKEITAFRMYFLQGKETIIVKDEDELLFCGKAVFVRLTQDETYMFNPKKRVETKARFEIGNRKTAGTRSVFFRVRDTGLPVENI